jgi:hypothetical protein
MVIDWRSNQLPPIKETKMVRSKLYVHMKSLILSAVVAGFEAAVLVIGS